MGGEKETKRNRGVGGRRRVVVMVKKTTTKAKNGRDKQADRATNKYVTGIKNKQTKNVLL